MDPRNQGAHITRGNLLRDLQRRRQELKTMGLRLPRQSARTLMEAGEFANAP